MSNITMVTTVRLPIKLHGWAKNRAKANGQSISSFLRVTLESLKHDEDQAKRIQKIKTLEAR